MEQHPVPQNVTTFQFRLIGDMTLKQFGYLAAGAILAYISYNLPFPFFITWPVAILCAVGGFGFAFVPIEERPMDVWVLSFFKSIYSPTQYIWSKKPPAPPTATTQPVPPVTPITPVGQSLRPEAPAGSPLGGAPTQPIAPPAPVIDTPITHQQYQTPRKTDVIQNLYNPVASASASTYNPVVVKAKRGPFDWIGDMFTPRAKQEPVITAIPQSAPPLTQTPIQKELEVEKKEAVLTEQIQKLQTELHSKTIVESRVAELQQQLTDIISQRDTMERELTELRKQSAPQTPPTQPAGTYVATPITQQGPSMRIITADRAVKVGLPKLTTFPNVVTGIVKDGSQNLLPGVLVTVKDKSGMPLRALKTNRLGQFAASTQLPNGTYFIEIEDPRLRFTFDRAQITLNGSIVPAIEIFAKSQKEITRAKLEKQLFGDNN